MHTLTTSSCSRWAMASASPSSRSTKSILNQTQLTQRRMYRQLTVNTCLYLPSSVCSRARYSLASLSLFSGAVSSTSDSSSSGLNDGAGALHINQSKVHMWERKWKVCQTQHCRPVLSTAHWPVFLFWIAFNLFVERLVLLVAFSSASTTIPRLKPRGESEREKAV